MTADDDTDNDAVEDSSIDRNCGTKHGVNEKPFMNDEFLLYDTLCMK